MPRTSVAGGDALTREGNEPGVPVEGLRARDAAGNPERRRAKRMSEAISGSETSDTKMEKLN